MLIERYEADKRRAADEDASRRTAEAAAQRELDQAAQRSAAIAEACRILRDSKNRPYRRDGKTIYTDWTMLAPSDRDIVTEVGIADLHVKAALRERVATDARADAIALAARISSTSAPTQATVPASGGAVSASTVTHAKKALSPPANCEQVDDRQNVNPLVEVGGKWLSRHRVAARVATASLLESPGSYSGASRAIKTTPAVHEQPSIEPGGPKQAATASVDSAIVAHDAKPKPRVTRADILIAASFQRNALMAGWDHIRALDVGQAATRSADKHVEGGMDAINRRDVIRHAIQPGIDPRR